MYCWGYNRYCSAGNPSLPANQLTPYQVTATGVSAMALGNAITAVLEGGIVFVWGANNDGQLGQGTIGTQSNCPSLAVTLPASAVQVSAGYSFMCALVQGGTVYCWGYGGNGQLGDGSTKASHSSPYLVPGLGPISVISAGYAQVFAAESTGSTVFEWGGQGFCEGLSTSTYDSPVFLSTLPTEVLLSQGSMAQGGCIVAH